MLEPIVYMVLFAGVRTRPLTVTRPLHDRYMRYTPLHVALERALPWTERVPSTLAERRLP